MHVSCKCLGKISRRNSKNCAYFVIVKDTIAVTFLRRIRVIGCLFYYFLFGSMLHRAVVGCNEYCDVIFKMQGQYSHAIYILNVWQCALLLQKLLKKVLYCAEYDAQTTFIGSSYFLYFSLKGWLFLLLSEAGTCL